MNTTQQLNLTFFLETIPKKMQLYRAVRYMENNIISIPKVQDLLRCNGVHISVVAADLFENNDRSDLI